MENTEKKEYFKKELVKLYNVMVGIDLGSIIPEDYKILKEMTAKVEKILNNNDTNIGELYFAINSIEEILSYVLGIDKEKTHISYAPLKGTAAKYGLSITTVCDAIGASSSVRSSLSNDLPVSTAVLNKIAMLLHCDFSEIMEVLSDREHYRRLHVGQNITNNIKAYSHIIKKQTSVDPSENKQNDIDTKIKGLHFNFDNKEQAIKSFNKIFPLDNDNK